VLEPRRCDRPLNPVERASAVPVEHARDHAAVLRGGAREGASEVRLAGASERALDRRREPRPARPRPGRVRCPSRAPSRSRACRLGRATRGRARRRGGRLRCAAAAGDQGRGSEKAGDAQSPGPHQLGSYVLPRRLIGRLGRAPRGCGGSVRGVYD
jgi:hypothetical protein